MKIKKRIIEIEVNDEFITGSGVVLGAAGSHNDVIMKVRFNSSWAGLNIIATFRDALGENPISVVLTALSTLVTEETDGDHCVHKFSVPLKAKAYEGKISLSFTGYTVAAVASEDREGVEYQETQAITSGTAYFNVLKSDAMLADDIFKTADVGQQLHDDVETLEDMYGHLEDALEAILKIQGSLGSATITIADLGTLEANIEDLKVFLKYKHPEERGEANIFDWIYPVGSIYMSVNPTDPAYLFGGSWVALKDRFLVGAGGAYGVKTEGGEATHTLTTAEMPRHSHYQTISNGSWAYDAVYSSGGANTSMSGYYIDGSVIKSGKGGRANTEYVGGGGEHNNLPPYYAVYMWRREA